MRSVYKSKQICLENEMYDGFIIVENNRIVKISDKYEGNDYVDYSNYKIIPGIFDTHNHGCYGWDLTGCADEEKNKEVVRGYLKALATQGVTAIFPTARPAMIQAVSEVAKEKSEGAKILGIHSEGPWLNRVGEKGIKTSNVAVDINVAKKMVLDGQGLLSLVALAPEMDGIDEIIQYFKQEGVKLAFAHSDCNYLEALESFEKGIEVITHTGNVMSGLHHRDLGGLGAALNNQNVMCEVICDGLHLCLEMVEHYFKVKPMSKFMMISDHSSLGGLPEGKYYGRANEKDRAFLNITNDGFILSDSGRLTGSSKSVLYGVKNLVTKLNIPLIEVMKMASLNPSVFYGYMDQGVIREGNKADFVVIDDDFNVQKTFVEGKKVYDTNDDTPLINMEYYTSKRVIG